MGRLIGSLLKSWALWSAVAGFSVAALVTWVAAAVVMRESTPASDEGASAAATTMMWIIGAVGAVTSILVAYIVKRRHETRRWLPLWEKMRLAAQTPGIHLVVVLTLPSADAGGQVIAQDCRTGEKGPLWLQGVPPGGVVCFSSASGGLVVHSWMTGKLWSRCSRLARREARKTGKGLARAQRDHSKTPNQTALPRGVPTPVDEAEHILREHNAHEH